MEKKLEGQKGLYFSVNSFKFVWYKDANVELRELGNEITTSRKAFLILPLSAVTRDANG